MKMLDAEKKDKIKYTQHAQNQSVHLNLTLKLQNITTKDQKIKIRTGQL